jgi:hypothetical protein
MRPHRRFGSRGYNPVAINTRVLMEWKTPYYPFATPKSGFWRTRESGT